MDEGLLAAAQAERQAPQQAQEQRVTDETEGRSPELQAAINYVAEKLYNGGLDEAIAKAMSSEAGGPKVLSQLAYKLAQEADANTGGNVPEEDLAMLGMIALSEVAEVAEAAGKEVTGEMISQAFKEMILTFLKDQGVDPSVLAQEYNTISDKEFGRMADQAPDDIFGGAE